MKNKLLYLLLITLSSNTYSADLTGFAQNCSKIKFADERFQQIEQDALSISTQLGERAFMSVGKPDHEILNEMSAKFSDIFLAVMKARIELIEPTGFLCVYGMKD